MQVFLVYIVLQPKTIIMKKQCDMKHTFIIFIVVTLLFAVLPSFGASSQKYAEKTKFQKVLVKRHSLTPVVFSVTASPGKMTSVRTND
jgi:hypothetical protein